MTKTKRRTKTRTVRARRSGRLTSGPSEPFDRENEANAAPDKEAENLPRLGEESLPFDDDGAECVVQHGERKPLDRGLHHLRKAIGGEKDAGEHEHREHHQVHEPGYRLDLLRAARDQNSDSAEGEGPEKTHENGGGDGAPDDDVEDEIAEHQECDELHQHEHNAAYQEGPDELAFSRG